MAAVWADNPRLTELIALVSGAAETMDVAGSRGYVAALARGGALLGSRWVEGPGLVGPGGPAGLVAPGDSPLGEALGLAVASYARGRVFVALLWEADEGSAQVVIAPVPRGSPEGGVSLWDTRGASGPLGPGAYCSRCGVIGRGEGAPCPTCGGRYFLRLVPELPNAA